MPTEINIGPYSFAVRFVPKIIFDDGKERTGMCDQWNLELHISEELPPKHRPQTLMHEVIHAIDWHMQIGLDEAQVNRLAHGMCEALMRNPLFRSVMSKP
jgi:hypothetical protein